MKRISAILVSYGHHKTLPAALESLQVLGGALLEVKIFDNIGDLEYPEEILLKAGIDVECLSVRKNIGYSSAANAAAKQARGDFLLFLSPDAEIIYFDLKLFEELFDDKIGAIGALTLDSQTEVSVSWGEFPGWRRGLRKIVGLRSWRRRRHVRSLGAGSNVTVQWLLGGAMICQRSLFELVGGFDVGYFEAGEDQDFGMRLKKIGLRSVVSPNWCVCHEPRDPDQKEMATLINANDLRFLKTHGGSVFDHLFQKTTTGFLV